MINSIIKASIENRVLVLLISIMIAFWGWRAVQNTPLDAIPDLSDVQVIVKTSFEGQSPQLVEDQVTYPISSLMMSVPKAKTVRGYSFFGDSYVYVLFEEGTDPYWARSRVLEYLNQVKSQLPTNVQPSLGPDASGVGWVYQYALVDRSHQLDLAQLRSLQDWFLKYELQAVPGVSEVAAVGGMVKQYQVVVNPNLLRGYDLTLASVQQAIQQSATEMGASVIELGEAEYMVGVKGYVTELADLQNVPVGRQSENLTPVLLKDIARVQLGAQPRRGLAELNGEGEVVGGIVVMRSGENAQQVIQAVKQKMAQIQPGLPAGVEMVEVYNRSELIERSVQTLSDKLLEEMAVVILVSLLFLWHFRSAWVAIISLPLGVLGAFLVMEQMGVTANIMSLGGIAIAIGTMVDAAIVMIENVHKKLEQNQSVDGATATGQKHWQLVLQACQEVGKPLFLSLLIIALSFVPIFALQEQAGRLFTPLALTKTLAMAVAAGFAITLVPVLIGYFIRGKLPSETHNPLNRSLIALYQPVIKATLSFPKTVLTIALLALSTLFYPWQNMGSEFMPQLDEGDLLYMPTTLPGISIGTAQSLLQQTDRIIKTVPEVKTVFGKIGRADTATDPAPLTMLETTIQLKDKSEWRPGMTLGKLISELDQKVQIPGLTNAWVQPIKTRIDMLSTGIKTPIGIKISADNLQDIQMVGGQLEGALKELPGTLSVFSDRSEGGRYIDILPDRSAAARYQLSMAQLSQIISVAVGGKSLQTTLEGRERVRINLRYPQSWRNSIEALQQLPILTASGAHIQLGMVADIKMRQGPAVIKSENARLNGWTFIDLKPGTDLQGYIETAQQHLGEHLTLPSNVSLEWSGQYAYLLKAQQTLMEIVPLTLIIIFILLYLIFKSVADAIMILAVIPFALLGSVWFVWALDYDFSIAVAVGMIALAGVATEFGVVMLIYLRSAIAEAKQSGQYNRAEDLGSAIIKGAVNRVRPKAMTVSVIVVGLLPILLSEGTGSEVMQRIAAPMIGGMISAPIVSMILIPLLVYWMALRKGFDTHQNQQQGEIA